MGFCFGVFYVYISADVLRYVCQACGRVVKSVASETHAYMHVVGVQSLGSYPL